MNLTVQLWHILLGVAAIIGAAWPVVASMMRRHRELDTWRSQKDVQIAVLKERMKKR